MSLHLGGSHKPDYFGVLPSHHACPFVVMVPPLDDFSPSKRSPNLSGNVVPTSLKLGFQPHQSFFDSSVALQRANPDERLMRAVEEHHSAGLYYTYLIFHPMSTPLHPILYPYDHNLRPADQNLRANHLHFYDTDVGRIIRGLHSCSGLFMHEWRRLCLDSTKCGACACIFSVNGYNAHIDEGICKNWSTVVHGKISAAGGEDSHSLTTCY
ncbi:hypothetical protein EV421DRAFT_1911819 [Armillaria borealis]|uniref:Uncharacterized protein n=1 Tax=Armillaria borealis TaxID=47425 RepID=A0AA39IW00_9AGAR|nr:hypothetical protein EV421DRAFT_1911819 [Armillaria borealis]